MSAVLVELFRHKAWATLRLIEHCRTLDDAVLDESAAGTYGSIRATLQHLVEADEGYFARLAGEPRPARAPEGTARLDDLAQRFGRLAPRWEELALDPEAPDREYVRSDGRRVPGMVAMAQSIHHAGDHRTHVLSILGARGLEVPELDLWDYALTTGQMVEAKA